MTELHDRTRTLTRSTFIRCFCVTLTLVAAGTNTRADDNSELTLKTERVIIFKDGYSLVIKRGIATTNKDGEIYSSEVPDSAVLGSFWATPREGRLITMTAGWKETAEETEKQVVCNRPIEILKANIGKECSLQLPDKPSLDGKIANVLTQPTSALINEPQRIALGLPHTAFRPQLSSAAAPPTATRVITGISGDFFVLSTKDGDVLLPTASIQQLTIKDMKTTITRKVTTKQRTKRLTFQFAEANKKRELLIMYFRPGIRWIPTYRINLTTNEKKEKTAEISLQAELLNEAEDLLDTPVDIVVGVPNFRFRQTVSPLVLEHTLRDTLAQAAPNIAGQFRNDLSNSLYTQRSGEFRRNAANAGIAQGGTVQLPNELTASGSQDLFIYNLPSLTLRKGERAAVPILSTKVPYRDVYTWDLQIKRSDIATAPSGSGVQSPLVLSKNKVWRQIELFNSTKLPWTTGAAMIMEGRQPLAQELLTYTSPKDHCRVPVTVSVDTRGSHSEAEVRRQLTALKWGSYTYAKIQQTAKLDLCNNKSETIHAEITLRFGGKANEASDDGKVTLAPFRAEDWTGYRGHPAVNNSSVVVWKATLKPGDTFEPTVDYHFFTRQ
ncbi:MAG: hypothetical protein VB876_15110 [Pirellulales bacterium]